MPLARKLAWRAGTLYRIPFDDAYSDALFGLHQANRRCADLTTFPGYARRYMWGAILRGIRDRAPVRTESVWMRTYGEQPVMVEAIEDRDGGESVNLGQALENRELWETVARVLSATDSYVVRATYQHEMSQRTIARIIGVTQMTVQRSLQSSYAILAKAM